MRTADGWPAVLGLAAMSGDVDFTSSRLLSHTLYEFLASELLAAAAEETQDGADAARSRHRSRTSRSRVPFSAPTPTR